jgi:DMSO/TMAO reductase YedYZ molybdopterin-dependent catalytic subunit
MYIDEKTMESEGHDTKVPPPSARTSEKMPPAPMVEQEKQNESRSGRMPRGKEEAGESRSTLVQGTPGLLLTMEDLLKLPRYELVTQFKCIEGWSQIVHWAGVRMADFIEVHPPALVDGREPKYVYMETPDGDFYNGYDLHVCRHPQTLLVTEMMGAPLTQYHGAPLRLHMPTKYGYKQIKRIGLISYTDSKPDDYWTKLGYDWYGGL